MQIYDMIRQNEIEKGTRKREEAEIKRIVTGVTGEGYEKI